MQLHAKRRIKAATLPLWADASIPMMAFDVRQLGRAIINVVSSTVNLPRGFGGSWKINTAGEITVLVERSFYLAAKKANAPWAFKHLVDHELAEARQAVAEARAKYPGKNPYLMAEQDPDLGGLAHDKVCRTLDGMSPVDYDKQIRIERKAIGWKP